MTHLSELLWRRLARPNRLEQATVNWRRWILSGSAVVRRTLMLMWKSINSPLKGNALNSGEYKWMFALKGSKVAVFFLWSHKNSKLKQREEIPKKKYLLHCISHYPTVLCYSAATSWVWNGSQLPNPEMMIYQPTPCTTVSKRPSSRVIWGKASPTHCIWWWRTDMLLFRLKSTYHRFKRAYPGCCYCCSAFSHPEISILIGQIIIATVWHIILPCWYKFTPLK